MGRDSGLFAGLRTRLGLTRASPAEFWRDALGGEWRCTGAGRPGTWIQIRPAAVTADPASGMIAVGYLIWNVTTGHIKRHAGGYLWEAPAAQGSEIRLANRLRRLTIRCMSPRTAAFCLVLLSTRAIAAELPTIQSSVTFDGQDRIRISWVTEPGEVYHLQTSTDLAQPWQALQTEPPVLSASSSEFAYELTATNRSQFFRVGRLHMALIPAGTFQMGDSFGEGDAGELPVHPVTVSAFYMDRTEVTKALWDEVHAWATGRGYNFDNLGSWYDGDRSKGADHPVHTINWYDMVKWCNARSEKEGRVPAYYTGAAKTTVYRTWQVDVQNDWVKWNAGYRLPTEAEWEKAARGELSDKRFPWGDTISHSQSNYYSDWLGGRPYYSYDVNPTEGYYPDYAAGQYPYTSPVASFAPNGYGLYDMAGNLWEWCWDWYGSGYYGSSASVDPRGPASGPNRVIRGGCWEDGRARGCRVANRYDRRPDNRNYYDGFRCVLPPGQ